LDQITSVQLSEWEAYDRIDPIGTWREDYRVAVLDSLIVNIVSKLYAKKGHTPKEVLPTEFMPNWTGDKRIERKQSVQDMKEVLMTIAKAAKAREAQEAKDKVRSKVPPSKPPTRKPTNKPTP
jgi:hypothetical protein